MANAQKNDTEKNAEAAELRAQLYEIMDEKGVTQNAWARKAGITPSLLTNFLYGDSKSMGFFSVKKLCDALHIPMTRLQGFDTRPAPALVQLRYQCAAGLSLVDVSQAGEVRSVPDGLDPRGLYAVEIESSPHLPPGPWFALVRNEPVDPARQAGRLSVVKVSGDSAPRIRGVFATSRARRFTLSMPGLPPEPDVEVEWAHAIEIWQQPAARG